MFLNIRIIRIMSRTVQYRLYTPVFSNLVLHEGGFPDEA